MRETELYRHLLGIVGARGRWTVWRMTKRAVNSGSSGTSSTID